MKNQKAAQRIIILFSITLMVFMLVISFLTFNYSKCFISSSTREKALQILSQTSSQADDSLYAINQSAKLLMAKTSLMQVLEYKDYYSSSNYTEKQQIVSALNDFVFINKNIRGAFIFDYLGNIYSSRDYTDQYTLQDFSEAARTSPGNLVWMAKNSDGQLVVCKELYNISLKPIGVLVLYLDEAAFSELFRWQTEELHSLVCILDKDSQFLVYSSNQNASSASFDLLNQQISMESPLQEEKSLDGRSYSFYRYDSKNNGFVYFYYVPTDYFTKGLSNVLVIILLITLLFFVLLFFLYYYVRKSIQYPLGIIIECLNHYAIEGDIPQADFFYNDEFKELYLHFTDMGKRIQNLVRNVYELNILNKSQEIKILQAQINPHFINNTLELINSIAANHSIPQICLLTKSLANILQYTISSGRDEVPLSSEIYHVNEYIKIQRERFWGELFYTEEIDEDILDLPIMRLTLQPIIENCFNHGFRGRWEDCQINLKAGALADGFFVTIQDNGIGLSSETIAAILTDAELVTEGNGIALRNIHRRLQLKYGPESGLSIQSPPGQGACITINVRRSYHV